MFTDIEIFKSEEFGQIRTVLIDREPWLCGRDVSASLGYSNTKDALRKHVDAEDKQVIQRSQFATFEIPIRGLTFINESGLYALIFGSKLPSAKRFKRWVTSEVLPAIRKTGTYSTAKELPAAPALPKPEQKLISGDERVLAYNRGVVLGVLRRELEEDSALEIYERLSIRGKGVVMKMLFGEVSHA